MRKFSNALRGNYKDLNSMIISGKMPVHFGGMSDPFSNSETTEASLAILKQLMSLEYPTVISTKNPSALLNLPYTFLKKWNKFLSVQTSFSTHDSNISSYFERNAPSPLERITAAKILSKIGIHTCARIQPIMLPFLEEIKKNVIPTLGKNGFKHCIIEFLKLPIEHGVDFKKACSKIGWNPYRDYTSLSAKRHGREFVIPASASFTNVIELKKTINSNNMSCGVGEHGLYHLSDTSCCCGIDNLPSFTKWNKSSFTNIIKKAKTKYVFFNNHDFEALPELSIKRVINSNSRLHGTNHSMSDYLKSAWNSPKSINSPASYFGVVDTDDIDQHGNIIYKIQNHEDK